MNDPYTPIHNDILEALCKINLSPYEIRVLFCIWRKTYGFIDKKTKQRKKNDWISGSQISEMTNLDRRHVNRALKGLKNKHVISRDDKNTGFSKEFMKLMSSVEMTVISRDDKNNVISRGGTPPPVEMTPSPSRDDNLSSVEGHTKEKKETIQKKLLQKKGVFIPPSLTEEDFIYISNYYKIPIAFIKSKYDDMLLWIGSNPNNSKLKGRNWKLTLMRFVKDDAIKRIDKSKGDLTKRGVDATNV